MTIAANAAMAGPPGVTKIAKTRASPEQRARTRQVLDLLRVRYPAFFPELGPGVRLQPLAVGIAKDLAAALGDEVSPKDLKHALLAWCLGGRYLRALTQPGAVRMDLAGDVVPVTAEQAEFARCKLAQFEARRSGSFDAAESVRADDPATVRP